MPRKLSVPSQLDFYLHFRESLEHRRDNEERQSEQRVAFLLTLVTLVFAAIGWFAKEGYSSSSLTPLALIAMALLFLFGLLTFARVIWRSRNTDELDRAINRLSLAIEALDPQIAKTLHVDPETDIVVCRIAAINRAAKDIKGTLAQFLYVTECLLVFGWTCLFAQCCGYNFFSSLVIAVLASIAVFMFLFNWSQAVRTRV